MFRTPDQSLTRILLIYLICLITFNCTRWGTAYLYCIIIQASDIIRSSVYHIRNNHVSCSLCKCLTHNNLWNHLGRKSHQSQVSFYYSPFVYRNICKVSLNAVRSSNDIFFYSFWETHNISFVLSHAYIFVFLGLLDFFCR